MGEQEIEEVDMRCVIGLLRRIHVCLRGMDQLYRTILMLIIYCTSSFFFDVVGNSSHGVFLLLSP
jgi:hypothetical protein